MIDPLHPESSAGAGPLPPLPPALDRICDSYEAAWKLALDGGPRPCLEDFVADVAGPQRQALLIELLSLETGYRRRLGEAVSLEQYRQRFPTLPAEWLAAELGRSDVAPTSNGRGARAEAGGTKAAPAARREHASSAKDESNGSLTERDTAPFVAAPFPAVVPQTSSLHSHAPSCTIGKFQFLERLGAGTCGTVWKARDSELDRIVAVKMPHAGHMLTQEALERFNREARAAAQLRHPNIVSVHEVTSLGGVPAIVSEYVPGVSLKDLLAARRLSCRQAVSLIVQLADALEYAHSLDVVHRDVKPANVMLLQTAAARGASTPARSASDGPWAEAADAGKPMLLDFGLALREATETTVTLDGQLLGTPAYMSPEQAAGKGHQADRRSDVYSLGVILYEMLVGELPFRGSRLTLLHQVLHDEPRALRKIDRKIPADLETICLKCLHKEADQRYGTAHELAEDLRRFLRGDAILARPAPLWERGWRWCRRYPGWAAMFATVVGLLVLIAVGSLAGVVLLRDALRDSEEQRLRAEKAENDVVAKLWGSYVDQARALRMSQRRGQRFDSLAAIRKARDMPLPEGRSLEELRSQAASAMLLPDMQVERSWTLPADVADVKFDGTIDTSFDAALERYSRPEKRGGVSVRRVADDVEILRVPGDGNSVEARLSPSGQVLSVRDLKTNHLKVWRLQDAGPEMIQEQTGVGWEGHAVSSDDGRLACRLVDGTLRMVTLADGKQIDWPEKDTNAGKLLFRPDGLQLIYESLSGKQSVLCVRDVESGAVLARLQHPKRLHRSAWHPDGKMVATACEDLRIRIWRSADWQLWSELDGHKQRGIDCVFSAEGDRLVSTDWHGLLRIWDVHSGRLLFTTSSPWQMRSGMTPAGRMVMEEAGKLIVLHIATGRECRTLQRHAASGKLFSNKEIVGLPGPEGRFLAAVAAEDDSCVFIDPHNGLELGRRLPPRTLPVAFDSTGELLTYGSSGLQRWPLQWDEAKALCRIGPPQLLFRSPPHAHACSADGQVVAMANLQKGALLLHRGRPGPPLVLGPQEDVRCCAVSPDGRFAATGSHWNSKGVGAKIWAADTGALVKEVPVASGASMVRFSPDGQWLLTSTNEGRKLWRVGTWELHCDLPRKGGDGNNVTEFSVDGRMLAFEDRRGVIRLVDPVSGRSLVSLEAPEPQTLLPLAFSLDGAEITALGTQTQTLHIWDLRTLRRELCKMNLDWDSELPPAPAAPRDPPRIEVLNARPT